MAKARPRPARRKSSTSRRKPARTASPVRGMKVVRMKPLYEQLGRTLAQLEKLPTSDRVKLAIDRLSACRADFEDICGPTMDVPAGTIPPG